jgi:AraC-like DNA-binding protein
MIDCVVVPGTCHGIAPIYYGYEECAPAHRFGPAVRDYYLLHYIFRGGGTLYKNGQAYSVQQGDVFVILPNEITTYQASTENPWTYCWIGFYGSDQLVFLSEPVLRQPPVRYIFEQIRDCAAETQRDFRIFSLTFELLWQLSSAAGKPSRGAANYAVYTRTHLENMYMTPVTIEGLAKSLHIDRRHLTDVFRKTYGISPHAFLMEVRMKKAREFLRGGYSVSDTAAMVGFSDLPNFSRKYKAYYGISPRDEKTTAQNN